MWAVTYAQTDFPDVPRVTKRYRYNQLTSYRQTAYPQELEFMLHLTAQHHNSFCVKGQFKIVLIKTLNLLQSVQSAKKSKSCRIQLNQLT